MGGDGFEPSKSETTDLQSVAFGRSATLPYIKTLALIASVVPEPKLNIDLQEICLCLVSFPFGLVPRAGIEPATQGFSVLCSTD